jgi:hypothetical protein
MASTRVLIPALGLVLLSLPACDTDDSDGDGGTETTTDGTTTDTTDGTTSDSSGSSGGGSDTAGGGAGLHGTGTWDGMVHAFDCATFETIDGGILSYTEQIDLYTIQCRSSDGTHQIRLSLPSPTVGTTDYTDGGVSFGPIDGNNAGANWNTVITNQVTIESVEMGTALKGSFTAEWEEGPGDDFLSGPAASCSGTFDVML